MSQKLQPANAPPPTDDTAARTCIVALGVLGTMFLMAALVCSGGLFWVMQKSKSIADAAAIEAAKSDLTRAEAERKRQAERERLAEERRDAEKRQRELARLRREAEEILGEQESQRLQAEIKQRQTPPLDLAEAIGDLNSNDKHRHTAAVAFLESTIVVEAQREKVASGLYRVVRFGTPENKAAAMHCLPKWSDPSIIPGLTVSLHIPDGMTAAKLEFLAKYEDASSFGEIAALLEDEQFGLKAKETLQAIGPETAPAVEKYLVSGDATARAYAKELLVAFDIDINVTIAKVETELLTSQDKLKRKQAALRLAWLKYDEALQPAIVKRLNETLVETEDPVVAESVVAALSIWGDESSVEPMAKFLRSKMFESLMQSSQKYDYYASTLNTLVKCGGAASLPILMEHFKTNPAATSEALIDIGPEAADEVAVYFNSADFVLREEAREILNDFDNVDGLIIDQCVRDLISGRDGVADLALNWLAKCDVLDDKADKVAPAIADYLQRSTLLRRKSDVSPTIARWATLEQKDLLVSMLSEGEYRIWSTAYERLVQLGAYEELQKPTAALLKDSSKSFGVSELLRRAGPAAEPLSIALLDEGWNAVQLEACYILAAIGGPDSQVALKALQEKSQKVGSTEVAETARQAERILAMRRKANRDGNVSTDVKKE